MKTIQVSESTNEQLNWLVAVCEGLTKPPGGPGLGVIRVVRDLVWMADSPEATWPPNYQRYSPATDPAAGHPILEREGIGFRPPGDACKPDGTVVLPIDFWYARKMKANGDVCVQNGPTMLISGLRCVVALKLGQSVEVPDEL